MELAPVGRGRRLRGTDMAGCCGNKQAQVDYVITFKHDGSKKTVSSLSEARMERAASPQGGTIEAVPRKK